MNASFCVIILQRCNEFSTEWLPQAGVANRSYVKKYFIPFHLDIWPVYFNVFSLTSRDMAGIFQCFMTYKSGGGGKRKIICYLIGKPPSLNNSFEKSVSREVKTMWLYDTIFFIPLFLLVFYYILFVVTICDDLNTQQILDQYCSGNEFKFFWL